MKTHEINHKVHSRSFLELERKNDVIRVQQKIYPIHIINNKYNYKVNTYQSISISL